MNTKQILITPVEAQKLLGVGKNKMYELLEEKEFPSFRLGNKWYINKSQMQDWANDMCKAK